MYSLENLAFNHSHPVVSQEGAYVCTDCGIRIEADDMTSIVEMDFSF